jgi:uncharacterized protein (TIGR02217 family)
MIVDAVRMPIDVERGVRGGPQFSTTVNRTDGGSLVTNQNWAYPLYKGQVGFGIQSKEDLKNVINFFYARRGGLRGFLFRDWSDYEFDNDLIGTGDGSDTTFQAVRIYDDDVLPFTRIITRPVDDSDMVVSVNGVNVSSATWSVTSGGILTFTSPPPNGHAIRIVTGTFNIPCRFASDLLEVEMEIWNAGSIPNIPIEEVRE